METNTDMQILGEIVVFLQYCKFRIKSFDAVILPLSCSIRVKEVSASQLYENRCKIDKNPPYPHHQKHT